MKVRDSEITALFWKRDERAIELVREQYGGYCHEVAGRILENREDTEECVNDTWLRLWDSIPPNRPSSLKFYAARIVRNLALNRLEKRLAGKRGGGRTECVYEELQEFFGASDPVSEMIERQAFADRLNGFLSILPPQDRNIFVRRFWFFETPAEIAQMYGIKEKSVYNRLFALRRKFRTYWEAGDGSR